MHTPLIQWVESQQLRSDIPNLPIGAQLRVNYRISEGEKERVQAFEGVLIGKHGGPGRPTSTITVRKVTQGFGVERTFPLHSPRLESVKVLRRGRIRRAKLYYLRGRAGKKARIQEKV
ncbi:MAG: 50S ribosomal protein L19 [Candidatus Lambdaproteobacteria bacterium]|nr:50S ribosomal protein L19 [Candidatus Lambdaproteobacteria bacterium]